MSERDWEAEGESRASAIPDREDEGSLEFPMEREGGGVTYSVKLPVFEGPLDLLLHLIRQNDVDITDIPVAEIGQQYLAYLEVMQSLNLDVAGEYLVMAATLALIKSRMLLPPEGGDEDEDEIDPRAELVARLLQYQRFKEAAEDLSRRRRLGRDVFAPTGSLPDLPSSAEREIEVGLFELIEAFRTVLNAAGDATAIHEIEVEAVTVRERMHAVMTILDAQETIEFMRIFESPGGDLPSRPVLIATFLGVLELVRLAACRIYQGTNAEGVPEGPIRIRLLGANDAGEGRSYIPENM